MRQLLARNIDCRGRLVRGLMSLALLVSADFAGQSETLHTAPSPFAGGTLPFFVVVADAEVIFEVFLRVLEVVLRPCCDHAPDTTRTVRASYYRRASTASSVAS